MYAKLVFPAGTENTQICRDIARTIANSTGAGGSTVGALEFVDAGNSTIDDTVAANWTLATGSIPTGATVEQDKQFFFQQTHANTAVKTVALRTYRVDASGFTKANNTSGYSSVVLRPVHDYGQSYQSIPLCPGEAQTANSTFAPVVGVSALNAQATVHVIAKDKVLAVIGDRWGYVPGRSFEAILEAPTQYENIIGRNKPSQTYFYGSEMFTSSYNSAGMSNKNYVVDFTSTNVMGTSYGQPLAYFMADTLHERLTDVEVRLAGMNKSTWVNTTTNPTNSDPSSQCQFCAAVRDTGQADGWATTWNYSTTGTFNSEQFLFPAGGSSWAYSPHAMSFDPTNAQLNTLISNQNPTDPTGTPAVQLQPVAFRIGNQGGFYDFTSECGLYVGTTNVPRGITVLNDGVDDYIALRCFDISNRDGVVVLKV